MEESQDYCSCSGNVFVEFYLCKMSNFLDLFSSCGVITLLVILKAEVHVVTSDHLLCSAFFLCFVLWHCALLAILEVHSFPFSSVELSVFSVASVSCISNDFRLIQQHNSIRLRLHRTSIRNPGFGW